MGKPTDQMLRTTYKGGEPVRHYCRPTERNRINNFITGLYGIGCRVVQDANEFKNSYIIVDGSSDIPTPPGFVAPGETACGSMTSNVNVNATGVVPFAIENHETHASIVDVDLANNKIIVKEGFSGVYSIKLQGTLMVVHDTAESGAISVAVRQDTVATECVLALVASNSASGNDRTVGTSCSASIDLDIDASGGDIDLDAYATVTTSGAATATLSAGHLDVHLIQRVDP